MGASDPFGRPVCGVESTAQHEFMAGGRYCSLPPEHVDDPNSPHVAYDRHIVTNHGADVIWLGPWTDGRPYAGEQADRLQREWHEGIDDRRTATLDSMFPPDSDEGDHR